MTGGELARARRSADMAILVILTAITRFAFRSHYLYDIDSVNFALALRRFDPNVHQPHPPGYFLYVALGRLFNLAFHNANTALVTISIVFSCAAVAMIYALADVWFGRVAAAFAGLIFLFSPLAWFHGVVALTYIVEAFFSALVGYLCWRAAHDSARYILPAAIAVGVAAGFRPSSILFLGPLLLYSLRNTAPWRIVVGLTVLALTLAAWFVPMIRMSGGAYLSSLISLWRGVPSKGTIFNSSILNSVARAATIAGIYFLGFGCAAILPFLKSREGSTPDRNKTAFTLVWIAPALLFFTFVYLKFVNSGYLLILAPPLCAWLGLWAAHWYASASISKALRTLLIATAITANALIFLFAPFYCSYRAIRRFETELGDVIGALPRIAPSNETMIVGLDSHFLGYRHAGYYLPEYLTAQYPEVQLASGKHVFAMQNGDTRLKSEIPLQSIRNFVIFPLPSDDSDYSDYMTLLRKRFPPGELRTAVSAGHEFTIGPIDDLHFLFPTTAAIEHPLPQ